MHGGKSKRLRMTTMTMVLFLVVIGGVMGTGTGTLSAFGLKSISVVCPLGSLETMLAGRTIMPRILISFLVIAGITVVLGKIFCGWICPVPLVRYGLTNKTNESKEESPDQATEITTLPLAKEAERVEAKETFENSGSSKENGEKYSVIPKNSIPGLSLLGAALVSTAAFGFPVFCLICPIGLIFATLFSLMQLVQLNEPTIDIIVFPVIIIIEIVFLKKWCSKWCPVGALLSIFSGFNRRFVPTVDPSLCLEEKNKAHCGQCQSACSFNLDPKNLSDSKDIRYCTKCKECSDRCPVQAIKFPWKRVL